LLSFYQKSSLDYRWHYSFIARSLRPFNVNKEVEIFFKPIADILALQCQRLGTKYGEISKRRRLQFGCYGLRAENNYAEVAEELGLDDVLDALPVPLRPQKEPPLELLRVIESLNERYGLLRSCGLPPEEWMTRTELSIDQLKQFKQLLKRTKDRQKNGMDHWPACRDSFEELKAGDIKFIGYATFDDFYFFYNAETTFSTMHGEYNDPEDCELSAEQCDDDLMHFLDDNPELFNPLTQYAFWRLVVEEIILHKVIKDPHFIDLKNQYPDYAKLSQDQLLKTLQRQLNDIRDSYIADGS